MSAATGGAVDLGGTAAEGVIKGVGIATGAIVPRCAEATAAKISARTKTANRAQSTQLCNGLPLLGQLSSGQRQLAECWTGATAIR
jgi:hypothetical protein